MTMESSAKDNINLASELLDLLTQRSNDPAVNDKILQLCAHFKSVYFSTLSNVASAVSPNWSSVTMLVFYNSILRKLFTLLLSHASPTTTACLAILPVQAILQPLFNFAGFGEKLLRHSAQNTLAFVLVNMKKSSNAQDLKKSLEYIFALIVLNEKRCCKIHPYNLELLNVILRRFGMEDAEACSNFLELFLPKLCSGQFDRSEYRKEETIFCALLKLLKEILNVLPQSHVLLASTNENIFKILQTEDISMFSVVYRLIFLQIIASCLKYFRISDSIFGVEAAKWFLQVASDDRFISCFSEEPDFVGFGSRQIMNQAVKSQAVHEFSSAEKMLLLNCILCALFIATKRTQGDDDLMLKTESNLKILLGESLLENIVSKLFEIFLEQDDQLVEFLLLHLINYIAFERFEKSFLVSPHYLFVKLLQHLSFDSSILLDWLTSDETQFLLYFLKYLKYLAGNFNALCVVCKAAFEITVVSSVINTVKNLRLSIEKLCSKDLFPYPVGPLLKVIRQVESFGSH